VDSQPPSSITPSTIEPREKRRLHLLVLLHALAISLPYAWAALITPPGQVWGGLLFNPDDQLVHLAWAKQAAQGHFFIRDAFTTENLSDGSRPLFFNALTWLMGVLSRLLHVEVAWVYHAIRVLSAVVGLYALHALTRFWTSDARVRILTVAIAAFAGGAGWARDALPQVLAGRAWIDRPDATFPMMPEAWGFASNFVFTLNAASFCLLCLVYLHLLRARAGEKHALVLAAAFAFLLANIHTYDALPLIVVVCLATLLDHRGAALQPKPALVVILAALAPVTWQVLVFARSEEFRLKAVTPTPAPPLLDLALSLSPLLILGAVGIVAARRGLVQVLAPGRVWPVMWAVVTLTAIYAPVSFARKMIEGLHIPLSFGAALGLVFLLSKLPSPIIRRAVGVGALGVLSLSMVHFVAWCLGANWRDNNLSRGGPMMPPLRISQSDAAALKYLDSLPMSQKEGRAVVSFPKLGAYVPRATGMSTYTGHWAETLRLEGPDGKLAQLYAFFDGSMGAQESRAWLRENRIGYVLEGEYERELFRSTLPSQRLGLQRVWSDQGAAVYAAE
jgi:hypothetical protein